MPSISLDLTLKIVGAVVAGAGLVIAFLKWRWESRPDELEWEIDGHYPIDIDNDRVRSRTSSSSRTRRAARRESW